MPSKNTGFIVTGVKEIDQALKKYSKEMKKILRKNMRKGMKPLATAIKNEFPSDTGETAKSIKVKAGQGKKRGELKVDVRSSDDNYIAKWIEFGTGGPSETPRVHKTDGQVTGNIKAYAPFRTAYDEMGDKCRKITIDGAIADANALLKQMAKEGK